MRAALEQKLATWATANSLPVQWQNTVLDPQPASYVRSYLIPHDTTSDDIERQHRSYSATFQVSLVLPINQGPGAADVLTASLAAAFPPATPIASGALRVFVLQPMSQAAPINEPDRYVVPCSAPCRADAYP
jgi:hypothetical protein